MQRRNILIIIVVVIIFGVSFIGSKGSLVENLEIPVGVGADVNVESTNSSYIVPFLVYSFEEDSKISSNILNGKAKSLGETRENRQLKSSKYSMIGLNRIFLFSEASATFGLKTFLDICLNNPAINDRSVCAVCEGTAEDMLKYKVNGSSNSAEFIEGQIKNLEKSNFFKMQYTIIDLIVRMEAEGRNAIIPYLEIKNNRIETTGLAIFKGEKMIGKTDINEARIINILKETNVRGTLTLQNDSKKYINCDTYSKRKIKCYKKDDKYIFIIDLNLKGNIITNQLYKNLYTDPQVLKEFEKDMENYVEKMCNTSINKIKCEYKTDILDFGRIAVAKYGRGTGIDWNKVFCDSDIQVNVKFTVDTEGRGNY